MNVNTTNFFRNKTPSIHQYADVTGSLKKIIPPIANNEDPLKLWSSGGAIVASTLEIRDPEAAATSGADESGLAVRGPGTDDAVERM